VTGIRKHVVLILRVNKLIYFAILTSILPEQTCNPFWILKLSNYCFYRFCVECFLICTFAASNSSKSSSHMHVLTVLTKRRLQFIYYIGWICWNGECLATWVVFIALPHWL